jgi:hypothetical protein
MASVIHGSRSGSDRPVAPEPAISAGPVAGPLLFPAFLAIAAVSLGIATAFALAGAWPVLPFAGLELGALAWALLIPQHRPGSAAASAPICGRGRAAGRAQRLSTNRIRMINLRRKPF